MLKFPFQKSNTSTLGEAQEMILLTIARAAENNRTVSPADLARELNIPPAPHLQSLLAQSLIRIDPSNALTLTATGRERARALLRRHRLAERFFTDILGLDWTRAHEEADKLEHVVTAEVEAQLASQLGEPDTCPHGNPIPNTHGDATAAPTLSLADCAPYTRATIARIGIETSAALHHLATLGLLPNVQVVIENHAPFNGPVLIRVGRAHYALGRDLASRIWVREILNSEFRIQNSLC